MTAAQEHLRQTGDKYGAVLVDGHRYDTGIPYGLAETQLALAMSGVFRAEISDAFDRMRKSQLQHL